MSDLSDFCGGAPDPGPEDEVKINLSRWFENEGAEVFWEKRPSYGYQTFSTLTAERPDLLVVGDRHTFAIEVKIPDGAGRAIDGAEQTYRYWRRFCVEDVDEQYCAAGDTHTPDAFLLATQFAPDGRLLSRYDTQSSVRQLPIYDDKRMEWADPPIHFLPDWEFGVAESVTRMLWRLATSRNDELEKDIGVGVGTMLSTCLDGPQPDVPDETECAPFNRDYMPEPRALYKTFDDDHGGGVACQNWRAL